MLHRFAKRIQRAFQLFGLVEPLAAHDQLRVFGPLREIEHVHRVGVFQHRFLAGFLLGQRPGLFPCPEGLGCMPRRPFTQIKTPC